MKESSSLAIMLALSGCATPQQFQAEEARHCIRAGIPESGMDRCVSRAAEELAKRANEQIGAAVASGLGGAALANQQQMYNQQRAYQQMQMYQPQRPMFETYYIQPSYPGGMFPGHYTVTRF